MSNPLFGQLGLMLFLLCLGLVLATAYFLPVVMDFLNLAFPEKWVEATRLVVQLTFGSWVGTVGMSIARIIVWLRAVFSKTDMTEYANERRDVTYVRDFALWLSGLLTALAAYMTTWVS